MENTLPKDHPWNDLKLEFKENIKPKTILKNIKQESQDECCLTRTKQQQDNARHDKA